jgi:hypothetical protein
MTTDRFNTIIDETIAKTKDVLVNKAMEYATEDRLHNFKVAAALEQCTPEQALFGFLAKHLVSLSDMCQNQSELGYPDYKWDEKIGDSINYLLLLRALVEETGKSASTRHFVTV